MGCVMMRVCNLDTCPMGICTQNPELRKRFKGKPEYIMNFMRFMAEDLREYMAKLGVRTVDELVGRTDLLKVKAAPAGSRAGEMDLTALLQNPLVENSNVHFNAKDVYNFQLEKTPDMRILMKKFKKSFDSAEPKPSTVTLDVGNTDRAFGTIIGSEITARFGNALPDDTFHVVCHGYGGQSFGAFIPQRGLTLELVGDANDYIGKGLSGGKLVVYPPKDAAFDRSENIVIGNVALYGATGGTAFINGVAGERFCVRNSGATAVVEGVGDHGCEYMTGGTVVVLGKTGKNFAAGMSGGIAYVLDEDWDFYQRVNKDMVSLEPVEHKYDVSLLKDLIREHVELTGSPRGREILDNFGEYLPKFKKVLPHDYDKNAAPDRPDGGKGRGQRAGPDRGVLRHEKCKVREAEYHGQTDRILWKVTRQTSLELPPRSASEILNEFHVRCTPTSSRPRAHAAWTAASPSARAAFSWAACSVAAR